MDHSMRQMAHTRKSWQKRGILVFESVYYVVGRYAFILIQLLLAEASQLLISIDGLDGRFGNEWVWSVFGLNLLLLADLILHLVFYGFKTIIKLRFEYVCEILIQAALNISIICYFSFGVDQLTQQIKLVEFLAIVLLCRLPIISFMLMEIREF